MTIEELRLEKGLTREAFAERLGIDLSTLEDYESGKRDPSAKDLDAIKATFGVELSTPALVETAEPEVAESVETEAAEVVEEAPEAAEAVEEDVVGETTDTVTGEAIEGPVTEESVGEPEAAETEAIEEAVAEAIEEAEAGEASAEEAALIAAAEKEARKAAKKARKAAELAARQKADEEASRRVIDIISVLSGSVDLKDRDAVAAARDAYDNLTDDQELLIRATCSACSSAPSRGSRTPRKRQPGKRRRRFRSRIAGSP